MMVKLRTENVIKYKLRDRPFSEMCAVEQNARVSAHLERSENLGVTALEISRNMPKSYKVTAKVIEIVLNRMAGNGEAEVVK